MTSINLLSPDGQPAGVLRTEEGFEVIQPWGKYELPAVELPEGWYELTVMGATGVSLELYEDAGFRLIELQATQQSPAYVRLTGGLYTPSLMVGCRPGLYSVSAATLRPFSTIRRYGLLLRRLVQALASGISFQKLWHLMRLALSKGRTYGIRARQADGPETMGVLSTQDQKFDWGHSNGKARMKRLKHRPVFLLAGKDGRALPDTAYPDQIYENFTVDASKAHDFIVVLGATDRLLPDALLLFAEHIDRHPETHVIVSDKWIEGHTTANVAWDPLLYARGHLPTPFAVRRKVFPEAGFDNQQDFSIIGIPVASASQADDFVEYISQSPQSRLACSIIIPTRDRADLLTACLEGLFDRTDWPHEVIVVDNGSVEPETFALFRAYEPKGLRVIRADIPFNFSILSNMGAQAATHPFLVFLNNDVVLHRTDWLKHMMSYAMLEQVGAVGAKLLYSDRRLQHGGVALGLTQLCGHLWRGLAYEQQKTAPQLSFSSLRSAVTAACLCMAKYKFDAVGGFDAQDFPVTLNDIDLCMKLLDKGWFNIYAAQAEAFHLEGESRGDDVDIEKAERRLKELNAFSRKWSDRCENDPYLSHEVARSSERFRIR